MAVKGDVVTAWTISLYVVTAAAGKWRDILNEGFRLTRSSCHCVTCYHRESEGHLRNTHGTALLGVGMLWTNKKYA